MTTISHHVVVQPGPNISIQTPWVLAKKYNFFLKLKSRYKLDLKDDCNLVNLLFLTEVKCTLTMQLTFLDITLICFIQCKLTYSFLCSKQIYQISVLRVC